MDAEPEPPKIFKYIIKKYVEKEAFKKIEEDPINSNFFLANVKVNKIAVPMGKKEEKKKG